MTKAAFFEKLGQDQGGWLELPGLLKALVEKGESLAKEELLQAGPGGKSWLEQGIAAGQGQAICGHLAAHKQAITKEDALEHNLQDWFHNQHAGLLNAAYGGRQEDVQKALAGKALDINYRTKSHGPALVTAAGSGFAAVVRLLLEAGADPLVADSDNGMTALAASSYLYNNADKRLETRRLIVEALEKRLPPEQMMVLLDHPDYQDITNDPHSILPYMTGKARAVVRLYRQNADAFPFPEGVSGKDRQSLLFNSAILADDKELVTRQLTELATRFQGNPYIRYAVLTSHDNHGFSPLRVAKLIGGEMATMIGAAITEATPENTPTMKFAANYRKIAAKDQSIGWSPGMIASKKITAKEAAKAPRAGVPARQNKFTARHMHKGQNTIDQTDAYSQEQRSILEVWAYELDVLFKGEKHVAKCRLPMGRTDFNAKGAELTVTSRFLPGFIPWDEVNIAFAKSRNSPSVLDRDSEGRLRYKGKTVYGASAVMYFGHKTANLDIHCRNAGLMPNVDKDGNITSYQFVNIDLDWSFAFTRSHTMMKGSQHSLLTTQALGDWAESVPGDYDEHGRHFYGAGFFQELFHQHDLIDAAQYFCSIPRHVIKSVCDKYERWLAPYRHYNLDNRRRDGEDVIFPQRENYVYEQLIARQSIERQTLTSKGLLPKDEQKEMFEQRALQHLTSYTHLQSNSASASWAEYMKFRVEPLGPPTAAAR